VQEQKYFQNFASNACERYVRVKRSFDQFKPSPPNKNMFCSKASYIRYTVNTVHSLYGSRDCFCWFFYWCCSRPFPICWVHKIFSTGLTIFKSLNLSKCNILKNWCGAEILISDSVSTKWTQPNCANVTLPQRSLNFLDAGPNSHQRPRPDYFVHWKKATKNNTHNITHVYCYLFSLLGNNKLSCN